MEIVTGSLVTNRRLFLFIKCRIIDISDTIKDFKKANEAVLFNLHIISKEIDDHIQR